MLASTIPGFLPGPSQAELQELAAIYGLSGSPLPARLPMALSGLVDRESCKGPYAGQLGLEPCRPFRSVSPAITLASLIGGGRKQPLPGEMSLAHSGVLFVDELPQFPTAIVDAMRSALESGYISITRNGKPVTFPAKLQLVAAMNPCLCGWHGVGRPLQPVSGRPGANQTGSSSQQTGSSFADVACRCSLSEVQRYQSRISGPILDRIDLICRLEQVSSAELFKPAVANQSLTFYSRILKAWNIQLCRQGKLNCDLGPKEILDSSNSRNCSRLSTSTSPDIYNESESPSYAAAGESYIGPINWTAKGFSYFCIETDKPRYSTRRKIRLARVARTIADLCECYGILPDHIRMAKDYVAAGLNSGEEL